MQNQRLKMESKKDGSFNRTNPPRLCLEV